MIKRILLMDSHAQASAVENAIKNRILELNQRAASEHKLSDKEAQERALLNQAFERMSSQGTAIPPSVTPSTWGKWIESGKIG